MDSRTMQEFQEESRNDASNSSNYYSKLAREATRFGNKATTITTEWVPTKEDLDRYILSGRLKHLPRRNPKVVRIFLSSTFTDMSIERNALFKNVYPRLQSYCNTTWNVDFQVVDMRWGVRSAATNDHSAAKLCMAELKICQEESLGPNFVLLLGQRYGSRSIPTVISESEFEKLASALYSLASPDDLKFLQEWYLCDTNSQPPQRRLQSLDTMKTKQWVFVGSIEPRLRSLLRAASDKCLKDKLIDDRAHRRYFWSVTDEEVYNGILNVEDPNDHCLCFTRYLENVNFKSDNVGRYVDILENGSIDKEAQALRNAMQQQVYDVLDKQNICEFRVPWCDTGGTNENFHAAYLKDFCESFYNKVVQLVDKAASSGDMALKISKSPLLTEVMEHGHQARAKLETFQGRTDILERIMQYIQGDTCTPFVVHGRSGFGKTSILATASARVFQWLTNSSSTVVVCRFLGTSPSSTNIESLLRSIVDQLNGYWNMRFVHSGDPLKVLHSLLHIVPKDSRLVLILDSLDQLSPVGRAHSLEWLPSDLPTNVKVIVSTLPDEHGILEILQARGYPDTSFTEVEVLDVQTALGLLTGWLSTTQKRLSDYQLEVVKAKFFTVSTTSPLYVKLMFDILRGTPSYMEPDVFAKRFEHFDSPEECIQYIIEELRQKHGLRLVDTAFALLHLSNQGLTENEIVHILSLDEVVLNDVFQFHVPPLRRLPVVLWTRIRHDVAEYIVEREANGAKVLAWYHRQFKKAGESNFIDSCSTERADELRRLMAEYFMGMWAKGTPKPFTYSEPMARKLRLPTANGMADRFVPEQPNVLSNKKPNLRKLSQLPLLLIATGQTDVFLKEIVKNIEFLEGMFEAYTWREIFDILADVPGLADKNAHFDYDALLRCLQLCSATASVCPVSVGPLLAGRLLPFYGASAIIDSLLDDIYSKGVEQNALVVPHNQLEGFGSRLVFEVTNEHVGPCYSIREAVYQGHSYIMSVSKAAAMIDMESLSIPMRYTPQLLDGDHFRILASLESAIAEYVAASLDRVPKVFVFSVRRQECMGSFDCRKVKGMDNFSISDMLAFPINNLEVVAVWGAGLHGLLLYGMKSCELLYRYSNDQCIFAVLRIRRGLVLVQPGQLLLIPAKYERRKVQMGDGQKLQIPLPSSIIITAKHCDPRKLIAFATTDNKLFLWAIGSTSGSRIVLDSPAHCLTNRDTKVVACTQSYIYLVILKEGRGASSVKWRIRKCLDWAAFATSREVVGYRFGNISVLQVASTTTRAEIYEELTFVGHANHITNVLLGKDADTTLMTSSVDGTIRVFDRSKKFNKYLAEVSKFDHMDFRIGSVHGNGEYAVSIAKDNKQLAAVWLLRTGKILHRLYHEGGADLKHAAVLGQCIVTADASGKVYFWNLEGSVGQPSSVVTFQGFCGMVAKSDSEVIIVSQNAITEVSVPFGNVTTTRHLSADKKLISYSWTSYGLALLVDPDHHAVGMIVEESCIYKSFEDVQCLEVFGQTITSLCCYMQILALAFAQHAVFYNYEKSDVLLSVQMKAPVLLDSCSNTIAIRSGVQMYFFEITHGVTRLGSLKLSSPKDLALLSPDGNHCLVTKLPKMVKLYRLSDMTEIASYSCYGNIECMAFTADSKHVLIGMPDTRLLIFLLVDIKCQGHVERLQGILCKPSDPKELAIRKHMLAAAADVINESTEFNDAQDARDPVHGNGETYEKRIPRDTIGIEADKEENSRAKEEVYLCHVVCSMWRRHKIYI